jgi:hypothetical protein
VIDRAILNTEGQLVHERLPIIPAVPILFPGSGPVRIIWDLEPGSHVVLLVAKRPIGLWQASGQISQPGDVREHSLGNAIGIAGIEPNAQASTIAQAGKLVLEAPELLLGANAVQKVSRADRTEQGMTDIMTYIGGLKDSTGAVLTAGGALPVFNVGCDKVLGE